MDIKNELYLKLSVSSPYIHRTICRISSNSSQLLLRPQWPPRAVSTFQSSSWPLLTGCFLTKTLSLIKLESISPRPSFWLGLNLGHHPVSGLPNPVSAKNPAKLVHLWHLIKFLMPHLWHLSPSPALARILLGQFRKNSLKSPLSHFPSTEHFVLPLALNPPCPCWSQCWGRSLCPIAVLLLQQSWGKPFLPF